MDPLVPLLLSLSPAIRYVAVYRNGQLSMDQRRGLAQASRAESDRYEELLVNPALLGLTAARGAIDCGGLDYVLVRYGHFFQLLHPIPGGHVSVALDPDRDALGVLPGIGDLLRRQGRRIIAPTSRASRGGLK